ncbi:normocyte-binding protein [Lysinibacillus sphaericus]|uniref:normocyte-binding protein n=1 Tax=Lysinibacillus sphaericus TaxID=1421 RepID=UPI001F50B4D0|nr:normocyte-binding protein [Lysinibacillus sphaericus]
MLKELMFERIRKIEDLEQRQLLKDIVSGVFVNLIDYQEDMNRKLEERIFNEMDDIENKYDIYATLLPREDVDPIHDCLFPICPTDIEEKKIYTDQLLGSIKKDEPTTLMTLFLACNSDEIQHLLTQQRLFRGSLKTSEGQAEIKVALIKNNRYLREIEKLYSIFQINGLPWKTINHPFVHKFLDVIVVDCPPLHEDVEIEEVSIDLEEYEQHKRLNMVPLWNIQPHVVKNSGFPFPAIDRVNFEHVLSLRKTGNQHGYVIDTEEENVRYVKRSDHELTIVSPLEQSGEWRLLKIAKVEQEQIGKLNFALVSNSRNDYFMHKLSYKNNQNVSTKGEIIRLINSFKAADMLELVKIDVFEEQETIGSRNLIQPFLMDRQEGNSYKKTMLLQFISKQDRDFIANDVLSFLIAEIQRHFMEYKCVGKWL